VTECKSRAEEIIRVLDFDRQQEFINMVEQRWVKRRGAAIDEIGGTTSMAEESLLRKRQTDIGAGSSGLSITSQSFPAGAI
jgi:hypothetical protein